MGRISVGNGRAGPAKWKAGQGLRWEAGLAVRGRTLSGTAGQGLRWEEGLSVGPQGTVCGVDEVNVFFHAFSAFPFAA